MYVVTHRVNEQVKSKTDFSLRLRTGNVTKFALLIAIQKSNSKNTEEESRSVLLRLSGATSEQFSS